MGAAALSGSMDHGSIATRFALGSAGGGPSSSAVAIALTVGILLLALLGTAWFVLTQFIMVGETRTTTMPTLVPAAEDRGGLPTVQAARHPSRSGGESSNGSSPPTSEASPER